MSKDEVAVNVFWLQGEHEIVCLVWDASGIARLRKEKRIIGSMIGSLPGHPSQNTQLSLPLSLLPEEVALCNENGWINLLKPTKEFLKDPLKALNTDQQYSKVTTWRYPQTESEKRNYAVYKELYQRGYYITSGMIFGGDYAVYAADPLMFHAEFIVSVREFNEPLSPQALITFGRLGVGVKKSPVLASVDSEGKICFISLTWRGVT